MACSSYLPLLLLAVCVVVGEAALIDLTHELNNNTEGFPMDHWHFELHKLFAGKMNNIEWIAWNQFRMGEHIGTHMDAPRHFSENGLTLEQINPVNFISPAVVIDLRERVKSNSDAFLLEDDLKDWEAQYGPIPPRAVVLMCTGWDQYWGNKTAYFGNDREDYGDFHWPGFHQDAVQYLAERRGVGIGVESVSVDTGSNAANGVPAHIVMCRNQMFGLECLRDVCRLPPHGATLYAFPIKLTGGTGGPSRVLATWDEDASQQGCGCCKGECGGGGSSDKSDKR